MTHVLVISTGTVIAAPGERVTISPLPAPVPKSVTGVSRMMQVAKRRRQVKKVRNQVESAMQIASPDVIVFDDWTTLEVLPATNAKVIALAHVQYAKDGSIKDWWRMRQYLAGIETTIVWHVDDRSALLANEIYNVRVIEDAATAWMEEARQALR